LLLAIYEVLFTLERLACDCVRQKTCLEVVSADDASYDDEVESQIRRARGEAENSLS
jgi:hypothetical protein